MRPATSLIGLFVAAILVACGSVDSPTAPEAAVAAARMSPEEALAHNLTLGIERAEFVDGFCFFVASDAGGGFGGFSGLSQLVTTPSGNRNYHCKGDVLFGALTETLNLKDVIFTGDFFHGPLASCNISATPGPNGQSSVTCHTSD